MVIKYGICIIAVWILATGGLKAQNMDPEIQQMTDALIKWTQEQFTLFGKVDHHKLDSMNQLIRLRQEELAARTQGNAPAADSNAREINVTMINSSLLVVPEGKIWKVKHVTCQTGLGDYNILVTSVKFREQYLPGESITMPAFTPEAALLTSDMSEVTYNFKIIEKEIK